jgi:hypothetical protein
VISILNNSAFLGLASSISSDIIILATSTLLTQNRLIHPPELISHLKSNLRNNHKYQAFDFTVNCYFIFLHKIQYGINSYHIFPIQSDISLEVSLKACSKSTLTISVVKSDFTRMILALYTHLLLNLPLLQSNQKCACLHKRIGIRSENGPVNSNSVFKAI